jgi:TonB family protein
MFMGRVTGLLFGALLASMSVSASAAVDCPKPAWPKEALRYELEGTTQLRFKIAPDGQVFDATVDKSSRWPLLDAATVGVFLGCRFDARDPGEGVREQSVKYVWSISPSPSLSVHPTLVPDSCAPSERFARFASFDQGNTNGEGILMRLLVRGNGEPFGIKAEAEPDKAAPELVAQAVAYLQTCRFSGGGYAGGKQTDTVNGRVIFK